MKKQLNLRKKDALIYLSLVAVMLVIILTMIYNLIENKRLNEKFAPLIEATKEIRVQTSLSHLWLEEILTGDTTITFDEVFIQIESAQWLVNSILEGGTNNRITIIPLQDTLLRKEVFLIQKNLDRYKKITLQRWKNKNTSGIGTEIDQEYDKIFNDFHQHTIAVEQNIKN